MEDFSALLAAARERLGITQAQLAASAGLTPSYVCLLESGKKPPPSDRVCERLAAVLGVPARQLLEVAHLQRSPTTIQRRVRTLNGRLTREQRSRQRVLESLLPPFLFPTAPSWIEAAVGWIGGTAMRKRRLQEVLTALGRRHQDRATAVSRLVDELPERDRRLLLEALPQILSDRGQPSPRLYYNLPPTEEQLRSPFLLAWTGAASPGGELRDGDVLLVDPRIEPREGDVLILRGPDGTPVARRLVGDGANRRLVAVEDRAASRAAPPEGGGAGGSTAPVAAELARDLVGVAAEIRRPLRRGPG